MTIWNPSDPPPFIDQDNECLSKKKKHHNLGKPWRSIKESVKTKESSPIQSDETISEEQRINDLSSRYLIPHKKLIEKNREGAKILNTYLKKKEKKYGKILKQAGIDYNKIMENYTCDESSTDTNLLVPRTDSGHAIEGLTKGLLMKIVRKSNLKLHKNSHKSQLGTSLELKSSPHWNILADRVDQTLQIIKWCGKIELEETSSAFLGKGCFAYAHKVENIANAYFATLKIAYSENIKSQDRAEKQFWNEVEKLKHIHRSELVDGIAEPPTSVFCIPRQHCKFFIRKQQSNFTAFIQKYYNSKDSFEFLAKNPFKPAPITKMEGLKIMRKLFHALNILQNDTESVGAIIHGDLKAENILAESINGDRFNFAITDFGGAKYTKKDLLKCKLEELTNLPLGTTTTLGSFTETDLNELDDALNEEDRESWINLQKKRDLYALTSAIWLLITSNFPYNRDELSMDDMFPKTSEQINGLEAVKSKYGNEVAQVLTKALSENPNDRPSLETILGVLDEEIAKLS